jgi:hypothetical protein
MQCIGQRLRFPQDCLFQTGFEGSHQRITDRIAIAAMTVMQGGRQYFADFISAYAPIVQPVLQHIQAFLLGGQQQTAQPL